jgi:hypothetical protein
MPRLTIIEVGKHAAVAEPIEYDRPRGALKELLKEHAARFGDEVPEDEEAQKEEALRCLIESFPLVLPWQDWSRDGLDCSGLQVVVVTRGLRGKRTDLVLLERWPDGDSRFVVIETKRRRNPEIRRTVIGQVLEYGAALAAQAVEPGGPRLLERARDYWRVAPGGWEQQAAHSLGSNWQQTWETACARAAQGDIRLVIVSDRIPVDLRCALTFLPSSVLLGAAEVAVFEQGREAVAVGASVGGTGTPELRAAWERWVGRVSLSAVEMSAIVRGTTIQAASVSVDKKPGARTRGRVDLDGVLDGVISESTDQWGPILSELAKMLETGEGEELLEPEPKETSVAFKAALSDDKLVTLVLIAPNEVTLLSYYFRPKPADAPARKRETGYTDERRTRLEQVAEQFASDVEQLLGEQAGRDMRTKRRVTVSDASKLKDEKTLRSLATIVCNTARLLRDS